MKKFLIIFITVILASGTSIAQVLINKIWTTSDSSIHRELDKKIESYEIIEINLSTVSNTLKNEKEGIRTYLQLGQKILELNLFKNEIRSSNYISTYTGGLIKTVQERNACITYAGYVNDNPNNIVRLTISDNIFRGYIVVDGEYYYFDQLKKFIGDSNNNLIISYRSADVIDDVISFCGVSNEQEMAFLTKIESSTQQIQLGISTCRILELATDADFEWFGLYGANSNNEILAIINMIQGIYQTTFNIEIVVVFQNVYTTAADPYTGEPTTDAGSLTLVNEIRTNWENNFENVDRDLVHLFTGRNPGVAGVTGRVYAIGTVCVARDESYGFTRDRIDQFETTAHEIGHNFGGVHSEGEFCGIANATVMCQGDKRNP